jgi:hypothetical protein
MKSAITAIFVASMALTGTACAKEEPKAAPATTAKADAKDTAKDTAKAPETKRVCIKTTDAKTGKEIEKCRDVKIHKKLEGTEIPPKK